MGCCKCCPLGWGPLMIFLLTATSFLLLESRTPVEVKEHIPLLESEFQTYSQQTDDFDNDFDNNFDTEEMSSCQVYTSVEELAAAYGSDTLGYEGTRRLYNDVLPRCLLHGIEELDAYSICERAKLAFSARKAAKHYARNRSSFWVWLYAVMYDFVRTFKLYGYSSDAVDFWNRSVAKAQKNHDSIDISHCLVSKTDDDCESFEFESDSESEFDSDIDSEFDSAFECGMTAMWDPSRCSLVCEYILRSAFRTNDLVNKMAGISESDSERKKEETEEEDNGWKKVY